jgi:hypothetical protein
MTGLTLVVQRPISTLPSISLSCPNVIPISSLIITAPPCPTVESLVSPMAEPSNKLKYLAEINAHHRDAKITFEEEGHKYTVEGMNKSPTSVTTLIHNNFPVFNADLVITGMMNSSKWKDSKYYGKTREQIKEEWEASGKEASSLGTLMHADIENFFNKEKVLNPGSVEFSYFKLFWDEFQRNHPGFYPYRTEWLVYDEDHGIAGSIDCVLTNASGQLIILDWKRSKEIKMSNRFEKAYGPFCHLDNCNYWQYSLQLNIYRHILETKYNKEILEMHIVVLHPNNEKHLLFPISKYDIASIWSTLTSQEHNIAH